MKALRDFRDGEFKDGLHVRKGGSRMRTRPDRTRSVGQLQPVPKKMRLEMPVGMQIKILNGGQISVNWSKLRNSNFSVSRGTNSK